MDSPAAVVVATVPMTRQWKSWLVEAVGFPLRNPAGLIWVAALIGTFSALPLPIRWT